ncbi:hypothetical protein [Clostridium sp.]|uniref:hypothetical protein n=1 Tax=Clostridium sp. TaxID=1506 RepID=UPI003F3ED01A
MLGFDFDKTVKEVLDIIKANELDLDIKEYLMELMEEDEIIIDPPNYFDITCISDDNSSKEVCVGGTLTEEEINNLSKDELLLHNELSSRANSIFEKIKNNDKKEDKWHSRFNKKR